MYNVTFSLTTVHREYAALVAMRYYDLCDTILQPRLSKQTATDQQEISQTMSKYNLNEPQAKAVLSSIKSNGFSLIQGCVDISSILFSWLIIVTDHQERARRQLSVGLCRYSSRVVRSRQQLSLLVVPRDLQTRNHRRRFSFALLVMPQLTRSRTG